MFALLKPIVDKLSTMRDAKGTKISSHIEDIWEKNGNAIEEALIRPTNSTDEKYIPASAGLLEAFRLSLSA